MSLSIEALYVQLQNTEVIKNVNMEIKEGEFISLLGPSGCGKSTLLKSIAGLLETETGHVMINGKFIDHLPPEKRGTVIVFQDLRLFPHMSAAKNIAFPLNLQKIPKDRQREIVKTLLSEVQLWGYEKRRIQEMSGGQLQRVALARALAADPKVLLLDEPFSGLDERLRAEMGALVRKIQRERKIATILVTHDKKEALQMSDRIALMDEGEILQYDTPKEIFYHPSSKAVADYFGKVNYIKGTVKKHVFKSSVFCMEGKTVPEEEGSYDAMVHPHAVRLRPAGSGAVIREVIFMGETIELRLKVGKIYLICSVNSREWEEMGLVEGDGTAVDIDTQRVCFFKREGEDRLLFWL